MSVSKISSVLPVPTYCDNCGSSDIVYTTNSILYHGPMLGDWPWIHFCNNCRAAVGCHNGTNIPMGKMADKKVRMLRAKAHSHFDRIWSNQVMPRSQAYAWLAEQLGIPTEECHLAWLTKEQLVETIRLSATQYNELEKIYARREKRRNKRSHKRYERESKRQGNRDWVAKYS